MSLNLRASVVTDPGLIRSNNEDSAFAGQSLIMVADGMGGLPAGELASDIVLRALRPLEESTGRHVLDENVESGGDDPLPPLLAAVESANARIAAAAAEDIDRYGMGTTVTAILLRADRVALVHVGDSRGYLFRDGEFAQLTSDDTYVQMLVDRGEITADQARGHPQRSLVTQALQGGPVDPHCLLFEPQIGDRYLICSDGLTDVITDDKIAGVLATMSEPIECGERLVKLTLAAGAPDNVTVVVADVVECARLIG